MKQWYVYVSDYGTRVYANIFEAETKDDVKSLLLTELEEWLPRVKLRASSKGDNQYITAIHEVDVYWRSVFFDEHRCQMCQNTFRKIDKLKLNTGGSAGFCNDECEREYRERLDPSATTSWNNGSVYKITHKPTGKFYIGVTTRWLMQRWWEHIKAESGAPFHQFMKEHDLTEFSFEVLEVFKPSEVNPYEREAHYINLHDAVNLGLNTASAHKGVVRVDIV